MNSILKNVLVCVVAAVLIAGAFLWFYRFPQTIDVEYPAVEFRPGQPASVEHTTMKIKGTLYRPLCRNAVFRGKLSIGKYDFTERYDLIDIVFYDNIRHGFGGLTYWTVEDGKPVMRSVGSIWKTGRFEQVRILVSEPVDADLKAGTDLTLVAPAQTYEQAQAIATKLSY
ncbi:hypothetical protein [Cohnella thermotolerans]|uniref:hypothetical protein n=1 Tax=Cohnella thermotolerans TaxID=329858 RepID=UPI000400E87A|nr:hypothetical protein [Cohnella thermotolerans]